jgi:hypothetical protein
MIDEFRALIDRHRPADDAEEAHRTTIRRSPPSSSIAIRSVPAPRWPARSRSTPAA